MECPRPDRLGGSSAAGTGGFHVHTVRTVDRLREWGPLPAREIADRLGIEHTAAHERLRRLERAGLVGRAFADRGAARYVWFAAPAPRPHE